MSEGKKYSVEQVRDMIEIEGLDYTIRSYLSADSIIDTKLSELWVKAGEALGEVEAYIEKNAKPIEESDDLPE